MPATVATLALAAKSPRVLQVGSRSSRCPLAAEAGRSPSASIMRTAALTWV